MVGEKKRGEGKGRERQREKGRDHTGKEGLKRETKE